MMPFMPPEPPLSLDDTQPAPAFDGGTTQRLMPLPAWQLEADPDEATQPLEVPPFLARRKQWREERKRALSHIEEMLANAVYDLRDTRRMEE